MSKDFLTTRELSVELNLSERTIRKLIREKKLPGRKIAGKYYVTREKLKNFIEGCD
jgi:excisionase family DNA binding protein